VLDEPTSALDGASSEAIRASLIELHGSLTMFIVTHQPNLLDVCDQILTLDGGRATIAAGHPGGGPPGDRLVQGA
jgi:ABC-type bacteriocin/lantibiotic exporter with double-glycine peptidase domain